MEIIYTENQEIAAIPVYRARVLKLQEAIKAAPHDMGCASLQGGPTSKGWGSLDRCDCWKREALAK